MLWSYLHNILKICRYFLEKWLQRCLVQCSLGTATAVHNVKKQWDEQRGYHYIAFILSSNLNVCNVGCEASFVTRVTDYVLDLTRVSRWLRAYITRKHLSKVIGRSSSVLHWVRTFHLLVAIPGILKLGDMRASFTRQPLELEDVVNEIMNRAFKDSCTLCKVHRAKDIPW